jgi:hypothetical protein
MKLSKSRLRQIIKEELESTSEEPSEGGELEREQLRDTDMNELIELFNGLMTDMMFAANAAWQMKPGESSTRTAQTGDYTVGHLKYSRALRALKNFNFKPGIASIHAVQLAEIMRAVLEELEGSIAQNRGMKAAYDSDPEGFTRGT